MSAWPFFLVPPCLAAAAICAFSPERVTLSLAVFNLGAGLMWGIQYLLLVRRDRSIGSAMVGTT